MRALVPVLLLWATGLQAQRPNVVLILADDLGWGDLGAYGQEHIRTPNLDRLAAEGARFTQFYAGSPICAPSREVLLTGLHTGHTETRSNRDAGVRRFIPPERVTLPEMLAGVGYSTAAIGKWGLGDPGTPGVPRLHGFASFFGFLDQTAAHHHRADSLWISSTHERRVAVHGYAPDLFTDSALAFIRRAEGPFFLYLATTVPHAEMDAPEPAIAAYRFPETPYAGTEAYGAQPKPRATYAAMVTKLDDAVGRTRALLDSLGVLDETYIFVMSDNGPAAVGGGDPQFFESTGGLRGLKGDLYEGGIRAPLIVTGPGIGPREITAPVAAWDILPTLAQLAGAASPETDGISLAPALYGGAVPKRSLYWEVSMGLRGGHNIQALRDGDWKLIVHRYPLGFATTELYDLATDPEETTDLGASDEERLEAMLSTLERSRTPLDDPALSDLDSVLY